MDRQAQEREDHILDCYALIKEKDAEIERLRAALRLAGQYVWGNPLEHALVVEKGKPEKEWPTLGNVIADAIGHEQIATGERK